MVLRRTILLAITLITTISACSRYGVTTGLPGEWDGPAPGLGATYDTDHSHVAFRVFSHNATAMAVDIYAEPLETEPVRRIDLEREDSTDIWMAVVSVRDLETRGIDTIYYGFRAWGPNWRRDTGFLSDVDNLGNRFNPNKLLIDPYARELSHDLEGPWHLGADVYLSGDEQRDADSGYVAPKGVVIDTTELVQHEPRPDRPFKDEIIYEVHVRGLTMNDPGVPSELRGTYAGAALRAPYLRDLGVTAIELLPVHETKNDQNDVDPDSAGGDNYWGYSSWGYFAPDRRYAADRSPSGPTREFREMVDAFHAEGIKVYLDVVYNHTAEGGLWGSEERAQVVSWRGLDNAVYYQAGSNPKHYANYNGVGPNVNVTQAPVRDWILDSLKYWYEDMGVDGFRFDLAAVLANGCESECFQWDPHEADGVLRRVVDELEGADIIAEPWGIGGGTYQLGRFPDGWAEWNGPYRDTIRIDQNKLDVEDLAPADIAQRIAGSSDLFGDDGRKPWHSVNYLVSHDGFTLRDLYSCNGKNNDQAWPYGPSPGGEDNNNSWDYGGDPARQKQAVRTGLALLLLSHGVPMVTGGDELYRTQYCNNNPYNIDSSANWIDWEAADTELTVFTADLFAFRQAHPELRPSDYLTGDDHDADGLKDLTWYADNGFQASSEYFFNPANHFLGYRVDADELGGDVRSVYVAYNGWNGDIQATLPALVGGSGWDVVIDSARGQADLNEPVGAQYLVPARSVAVFVER